MHRKVFISYRVADTSTTAGRLAAGLRRTFGDAAVFLDYRSIDPSEQWPEQLESAVANAAVVLVLIGERWLTVQDEHHRRRIDRPDDWVRQEVAAGLGGDAAVLPLLVNGAEPISGAAIEDLPDIAALATAQCLALHEESWATDFGRLTEWLESRGLVRDVTRWSGNPYLGLSAFSSEHAAIYFGREDDTDALVHRIGRPDGRVVGVIGSSGSGKSSLVAAGLIPQLAAGVLPGSEHWVWVRFTPAEAGDDPISSLALRLGPHLAAAGSPADVVEHLRASPEDIDSLAAIVLADRPASAELFLFVDQFEELFIRVAEALRAPFVNLVAAVARSARTRLVLTLRADYYEHCTQYGVLTELFRLCSFPLSPPGITALREMVEGPARAAGLEVESALVNRILNDTGTELGALALVEFTLERLYEVRVDGTLTLAAYEALGGVGGAIEAQGERVVVGAGGRTDEAALGNLFRALAAVDATGGAVRKRSALEALGAGERAIVDRLVEARLLVTNTDADGAATVEVAHEAVLRHWQRFRRWLDENRELELWRQRLAVMQKAGSELRGRALTEALGWLNSRREDLTEEERTYIRRTRGRLRVVRSMTVVAVVVFGAVFTVAFGDKISEWSAYKLRRLNASWSMLSNGAYVPPMQKIALGAFRMGDLGSSGDENEKPVREVHIGRAFWLGRYEVTFAQYDQFAAATERELSDDKGSGGEAPVTGVSVEDAKAYAAWLSEQTGKHYRLPTEAEWEYAARAGTTTRFSFGDDEARLAEYAWFGLNSNHPPRKVGTRNPNRWGLHDMHGSVWEWIADCWHDSYLGAPADGSARLVGSDGRCSMHVIRGGGWNDKPEKLRSSSRRWYPWNGQNSDLGFRLARDL